MRKKLREKVEEKDGVTRKVASTNGITKREKSRYMIRPVKNITVDLILKKESNGAKKYREG
jgi:hypothetical protein